MGKHRLRIPNEDIYQRINYLYQAAHESLKKSPNDVSLCRFYIYTLRTITRRSCLHLHPDMKRNMCKRCCVLLIPGVTAIVRTRKKREKHTVVTCLECGTPKRYVYRPTKIPWIDKSDAWEDKIVFGKPVKDETKGNQQQNKKNQGKTKTSKQAVKGVNEKAGPSNDAVKDECQTDSEEKKRGKNRICDEIPGTSKEQDNSSDFKSKCKKMKVDGVVTGTSSSNISENVPSSSGGKGLQGDCEQGKDKAGVESSPNPNEKVEVREERPDEYLYKMTFVHGFYPFLG